jgi:glycosyltransferase involved in cell wall biosynthesis
VKVQALIPCFNESNSIMACISSLLDGEIPESIDFEILVSDNASSDKTADIVELLALSNPKIKLFRQTENIGARRNWRFLVQQSDAEWIFFIDAHDQVERGYVHKIVSEAILSRSATIGHELENWILEKESFKQKTSGHYKFSDKRNIRAIQAVLYLNHNTICHALIPRKCLNGTILETTKVLSFDLLVTFLFLSEVNLKYVEKNYIRRYVPNSDGNYSAANSAGKVETRQSRVSGLNSEVLDDSYLFEEYTKLLKGRYSSAILFVCSRILRLKYSKSVSKRFLFRAARRSFGLFTPWKAWVDNAIN